MKFPENLKYSEDHEWVKIDGNIATIGITEFAQSELGDVVFIDLPEVDDEINEGEPFGTIEAVKTVSDMLSPLSGKVMEVNESLNDEPETINSDPYEKGWIVKIEFSDKDELKNLMDSKSYKEFVGK
ncbi:MAG: glycine cleavage system protein GcvH [Candidatus Marinimicrobia bacterium]|jgi:glycine cleavage system H protein|nr:glycine cleavage system protein GcvH [Candidatus Neomarinimicrobiota bacterium]